MTMKKTPRIFTRKNIVVAIVVAFVVAAFAVILAGVLILMFWVVRTRPIDPKILSPLQYVPFPTETELYPDNWPGDLIYPKVFRLVEVQSGNIPESTVGGYSTKLYFRGSMDDAILEIGSFFTANAWRIAETTMLDGNGVLVEVERGDSGYGTIVMEPDPESIEYIRLLVVVFP